MTSSLILRNGGYYSMVIMVIFFLMVTIGKSVSSKVDIEMIDSTFKSSSKQSNQRINQSIVDSDYINNPMGESGGSEIVNQQFNDDDLLSKRRNPLCIDEFIFCASSFTCLDVVCVDNLIKQIDSCTLGTIYCPETDECLNICPPSNYQENLTPTIVGIYNSTEIIDGEPGDNVPEDEGNATESMVIVPIVLNFQADFSTVVGNQSEQFIETLRKQLIDLTNLPDSSIQNLIVLHEPFKVTLDLVYWPEGNENGSSSITSSVFREIVDKVSNDLSTDGITLKDLNGGKIVAYGDDYVPKDGEEEQEQQLQESTSSPPPSSTINPEIPDGIATKDESNLTIILSLTVGVVVMLLIIIVGVIYSRRGIHHKRRRVTPFSQVQKGRLGLTSSSLPFNNSPRLLTGNREDKLLNRSDDDSGSLYLANKKLQPSEIIDGLETPEPAIYVPPRARELGTPISFTNSVQKKMKRFRL